MAYTFDAMKAGYARLWREATVKSTAGAASAARTIIANREKYEEVATAIGHGELWPLIGALHHRESNCDFSTHLHNGDSLQGYTRHVPAGRPQVGHAPPFTWTESAIDALDLKGWRKISEWPLERWLYEAERYNGWGYLSKINSPYLWAGTSLQQRGKYTSDGHYSSSVWDTQLGVVAVLKAVFDFLPDANPLSDVAPPSHSAVGVDAPALLLQVAELLRPVLEQHYVVLSQEQFATLVKTLKGAK